MSHVTVPPCVDNVTVQEQNPNCETTLQETTEQPTTTLEVTTIPETTLQETTLTTEAPTTIATTSPTTQAPSSDLAHTGFAIGPLVLTAVLLISSGVAVMKRRFLR